MTLRDFKDGDGKVSIKQQFLADFALLSAEAQQGIASRLTGESPLPVDRLSAFVDANPRSMARLYVEIMEGLPFGIIMAPLRVLFLAHDHESKYLQKIAEVLGSPRTFLAIDAISYVHTRIEHSDKALRMLKFSEAEVKREMPEAGAVASLMAEIGSLLVTISEVVEKRLPQDFAQMEKRVRRAEEELELAQKKWNETREREAKAHARGKERATAEARASAETAVKAEVDLLRSELLRAETDKRVALDDLNAARQKLALIESSGGATPERVAAIRSEILVQADERVRSGVSAEVRPWLARLNQMEAQQAAFASADKLSLDAVDTAIREAADNDLLLNWQSNREKALPVIERRLEEVDQLMARMLVPSAKLKAIHHQLREAVIACRKTIRVTEPLGGIVAAMLAGVKSAKDEDMASIAEAIDRLRNAGVLEQAEANSLLKSVNQERQLRLDRSTERLSVRARLAREFHARHGIDIFIDAYNFMHTVQQYFSRFARESKHNKGKYSFGQDARDHLASMVKSLHEMNVGCRVLIFLDGINVDDLKPFPGVKFILPSQQKFGPGQADEEILHHVKLNRRPDAKTFVVTNDKAVQQLSDMHLSPGEFATFLVEVA
jgi:hypothetical protein